MTFNEAEELMKSNINRFQNNPYFTINGANAEFKCFLILPADSELDYKRIIYEDVVSKGTSNEAALRLDGVKEKELQLFIIYQQGIDPTIIVFDPALF